MKLGIVGHGVVGSALERLFYRQGQEVHSVAIYDPHQADYASNREKIQDCDLAFVAVPTQERPDGSCDTSIVEEVVRWLDVPTCIKSTVPPGTTDALAAEHGKALCFSPEYVGETPWHLWRDLDTKSFVIVGGAEPARSLTIRAYREVVGPQLRVFSVDTSAPAELCKYMVNAYLATKVAFVNQFYDLAQTYGVNFDELRELWLADARIGRSHSMVTEERGYGGRCFPKDMAAIIQDARKFCDGAPLLEAVDRYNDEVVLRAKAARSEGA
jgi:UDPglucose 6-dehydrogenase